MRSAKIVLAMGLLLALIPAAVQAGDFDWMRDFNVRAEVDPGGFKARLAARFHTDDAQINAVIGTVAAAADVYMIFRLGEMCSRPPDYVLERYKSGRGKGWGVLAKSLGIKPGSKEFHALKRGDDLYDIGGKGKGKNKGKSKGRH
jgi:hypothetical protein